MSLSKPIFFLLTLCALSATLGAQGVKSELRPLAFTALDTNKDGKLSAAEARVDPDLYSAFESLDVNQDGFLSPDEFNAWPRALHASNAGRDPTTVPGGSAGAQHMPSN